MIKNKKQMLVIISVFLLVVVLFSFSYAYFNYTKTTGINELSAGDIYFTMVEGNGEIELTNVFPETAGEARSRNDNYITFSVNGKNTSNRTIYYEFLLNHGTEKSSPKSRYNDEDLRFDLIELDSNGNEISYLVSNAGYSSLVNERIWVDTVDANTTSEITRYYKIRMWLDENVIISDSEANANYRADEYANKYATIKLTVSGDFNEKSFGYRKVKLAIENKQNALENSCNPVWVDNMDTPDDSSDDIVYFSGTDSCVNMNYVWYSGKLWRITAIYPNGEMKLLSQDIISTLSYGYYANKEFANSYMYRWLNEEFYETLYNADSFIDKTKKWNSTNSMASNISEVSNRLPEETMDTANVGLVNSYETYNSYRNTTASLGFMNTGWSWFLLNRYNDTKIWQFENGSIASYDINMGNARGVRPAIILKYTVAFTGEGSKSSPYRIVGDLETGQAGDLINSRLSGEYVRLSNGESNQLFRIIEVENGKTKIFSTVYAGSRAYGTDLYGTVWGSGTTTGSGTVYTYLNDTYYANLVDTYGELFDTGTYYMGETTGDYLLGVCANTTSGNTKTCTKTSNKGTFKIGLPRLGEMFAAQPYDRMMNVQINWYNGQKMWFITPYSNISVWYLKEGGEGDYHSPNGYYYYAHPTLHLKSTVKIISGDGTQDNPYIVGL